jgi:hypothetical protein
MAVEYKTVKFTNDEAGIRQKNVYATRMANEGWRIASEVIESGHIKGGQACCLASICYPWKFLSGRTPSMTVTTFIRVGSVSPNYGEQLPPDVVLCPNCGGQVPPDVVLCPKCDMPCR